MYPNNALVDPLFPRCAPTNGSVMRVRPSQPKKAEPPMLVTQSGTVTSVRPLQPENAYAPMLVTVLPPRAEGTVKDPMGAGEMAAEPSL